MLPYKMSQKVVDFLLFQRTNEEAGTINRLGHHEPDIYRESLDLLESKRPVCSVIKENRPLRNLLTLVCWIGGTCFYYKEESRSQGSGDFDPGLHLSCYIYNSTTLVNLFHFSWTQVLQIWGENDNSMEHRELLGRWNEVRLAIYL